jgi:hypothetical protein
MDSVSLSAWVLHRDVVIAKVDDEAQHMCVRPCHLPLTLLRVPPGPGERVLQRSRRHLLRVCLVARVSWESLSHLSIAHLRLAGLGFGCMFVSSYALERAE